MLFRSISMPGLKYSRQRESIINCLKGRKDHPTADMIYASVREEYPKISLGTVYRNLSLLVDQGEILRFSCGEGQDHYDADTSQHYHFVCKKCRAVSDLHMSPLEHIDVLAKDGFDGEIDGHFVLFYGTCGKCKENEKNS